MFLIMFKTGHALPLAGARLLRPRGSRGEHAEHPRDVSGSWPRARQIRDLDSAGNRTRTRTVLVRELSVSAFSPRKQTRPRTGRVLGNAADSTVREPAAATATNCPQAVRSRELVTGAICPRAWPDNELSASVHRRVHPAADHLPGSHPHHSRL